MKFLYPLKYIWISFGYHSGYSVDFGYNKYFLGKNQKIYSIANGKVIYVKKQSLGGWVIRIKHDSGFVSEYAHLQNKSITVKVGDDVYAGQHIANMGNSGIVTGYHLHFSLYNSVITNNKTKLPCLEYLYINDSYQVSEKTQKKYKILKINDSTKEDNFLGKKGYLEFGDTSASVGKIAIFMYKTFPAYTNKKSLGDYYGKYIKSSILEFQKRTKLKTDGIVGLTTLNELKKYGFKEN